MILAEPDAHQADHPVLLPATLAARPKTTIADIVSRAKLTPALLEHLTAIPLHRVHLAAQAGTHFLVTVRLLAYSRGYSGRLIERPS